MLRAASCCFISPRSKKRSIRLTTDATPALEANSEASLRMLTDIAENEIMDKNDTTGDEFPMTVPIN